MNLIELENIEKAYPLGSEWVPVLKGISISIQPGEYVALTGASGSGKSTLMNILGCLDRPTGGNYYLEGKEMGRASNDERAMVRNRRIGFVFQSFNLLARTSALDNVIMPLTYTNGDLPHSAAKKRGLEMLKRVGLLDRKDHTPAQLSGGQQQRVAIARALVNHPPLLFADEPTGNLDSKTSIEVMKMFDELNAEGITIILVTHSFEIAHYAKRIIQLRDGEIVSGVYGEREKENSL